MADMIRWDSPVFPLRRPRKPSLPPQTPTRYVSKDGIIVRHELLRHMPLSSALLLTALMHLDEAARTDPDEVYRGWFRAPTSWLSDITMLSPKALATARQFLKQVGLVLTRRRGMPATLEYYLEVDRLADQLGVLHGERRHG